MPACSIVKQLFRGAVDDLVHDAEGHRSSAALSNYVFVSSLFVITPVMCVGFTISYLCHFNFDIHFAEEERAGCLNVLYSWSNVCGFACLQLSIWCIRSACYVHRHRKLFNIGGAHACTSC